LPGSYWEKADMTVSTEQLLAYLDGALPPGEMKAVETALAADPELRRKLEHQRMLAQTLSHAFSPVLDEPVPERLLQAVVSRTAPTWPERMTAILRDAFTGHPLLSGSATATAALAAGLVLGVFASGPQRGDFASGPQGLVARAGLAQTLDRQLASNQEAGAARKVGLTFRNAKGAYCRTFTVPGSAGIACHEASGWAVAALASTDAQTSSPAYQMAGSDLPESIRDTATAMMAGAALNAEAEKQARDARWPSKP
jgi:hypothetical protein